MQRIDSYAKAADQAAYYQVIRIPKRGPRRRGQFRTVHKAKSYWLGQIHYMMARLIAGNTSFQPHVQGFVHRRSILTNASQHLGARIVLHGDLTNFFDSITVEQVRDGLESLASPPAMASLIASVCTIDGRLRQGTHCAPILANLVCRQLDVDMLTLAAAYGGRYTRYADDLTFSGEDVPTSEQVRALVERHGFQLRDGRCYRQQKGRTQYVTGLTVADERPRLPRKMKRNMRLVLYYVEKYGIDSHLARTSDKAGYKDQRTLEGALRFFHSIEPELTSKLRGRFRKGLAKSKAQREQS